MEKDAEKRIMTLHPEGKEGVNILKEKYDQMHAAILEMLHEKEIVGFSEGIDLIKARLDGKFEGSIAWYYTSVKLDMEARGELIRMKTKGKQMMRKA
mgnify:CR=1 FL=1